MLLHGKVLSCRQRHIGDQQTLHGGVFGRIDKAHDTIQCARIAKGLLVVKVVIVRQTHTAKDDLVALGTESYECHHLVEGLVRVCKEWDLLSRHERVVEVDTSDTCGDQLGGLVTTYRIDRRSADLYIFAL